MTIREDDMVAQLGRLLAGWSGENELSVGPHMLAQGLHEARDLITALSSEREILRRRVLVLERKLKEFGCELIDDVDAHIAALDTGVTGG